MKQKLKYISIICFLFFSNYLVAQQVSSPSLNIPVSDSPVAGSAVPYPDLVNLIGISKFNYVRTIIPDQPLTSLPLSAYKHRQTTEYFDGLGRPLQTVIKKGHADGYDLIQPHVYDELGREKYSYLPFAAPNALATYAGKMRLIVSDQLREFYDQNGPDEPPYARIDYDDAEAGKVIKRSAPGRSWVGSERGSQFIYTLNQANEVRQWDIGRNEGDIPTSTKSYGIGELNVTQTINEDGKMVREYTDKSGLVILRKVQAETGITDMSKHLGFACTYFVYDDQNRLRYILPPLAVSQIDGSWDVSQITELCFSNFYDRKGRIVLKKVPGKAIEENVYDKRGRLVFTRDGNLRGRGRWKFTVYDGLNRNLFTGIFKNATTRISMQNLLDNDQYHPPLPNIWGYIKNYALMDAYPSIIDSAQILTYSYYDNYNQIPSGYDFNAALLSSYLPSPLPPELDLPVLSNIDRGRLIGQKSRIIDPENANLEKWILSVQYYDNKGRIIQTKSSDIWGGIMSTSTIYNFQNMPMKVITSYVNPLMKQIPNATDGSITEHVIEKTYTRNLGTGGNDMVWKIDQKINGGPIFNIANYDYDHLGRLVVKDLRAGLILNEYNIRGLLTRIDAEDHSVIPHKPIFDERLRYGWGFASKLYDGNIAGVIWSGSDAKENAYGYSYDMMDRLIHAEFRTKGTGWSKLVKDYSVSKISYDLNGNLKNMWQRGGHFPGAPQDIDKLSYKYEPNSNKLIQVEDAGVNISSLPDFKNAVTSAIEYEYDPNGNLTYDANKNISISYNYLNQPDIISTNSGNLYFVYDSKGNLLEKRIKPNSGLTSNYFYVENFVFQDSTLQFILNEEGRARPVANDSTGGYTRFVYDYFVKDHLNNIRSTVTANPITAAYLARHEIATANLEQLVFDNIPNVRDTKPGSINPPDGMAAHLVASDPNKRVGTAILLKVMPGDKFSLSAKTFFEGEYNDREEIGNNPVIESLLGALMGGGTYSGIPVNELPENIQTIQGIFANPALAGRIADIQSIYDVPTAPKAHLNYLFFNDNFELQENMSGSIQIQPNGTGWGTTGNLNISNSVGTAPASPGFLLVYVDNQSIGKDVWFDDIHLEHYTSSVLSEDHYYPMGLTINTMNNSSVNAKQPYKLTGKELENSFNLNVYNFGARIQDMQLGRWWQVDPLADMANTFSPYVYCYNNPTQYLDPDGRFSVTYSGDYFQKMGITDIAGFTSYVMQQMSNLETFSNNNGDAMRMVSTVTGVPVGQIMNDFKAGQGPTFILGAFADGPQVKVEKQDINNKTITLDGKYMAALYKDHVNGNREEEYYQGIANLMYMIHEYGHYGDKVTNKGVNSGQDQRDPGDLTVSSDPKGHQLKKSVTGHRGTDIDQFILFNMVIPKNISEESGLTSPQPVYWNTFGTGVSSEFKNYIKGRSKVQNGPSRFGPYENH